MKNAVPFVLFIVAKEAPKDNIDKSLLYSFGLPKNNSSSNVNDKLYGSNVWPSSAFLIPGSSCTVISFTKYCDSGLEDELDELLLLEGWVLLEDGFALLLLEDGLALLLELDGFDSSEDELAGSLVDGSSLEEIGEEDGLELPQPLIVNAERINRIGNSFLFFIYVSLSNINDCICYYTLFLKEKHGLLGRELNIW